jgi:hypothetical protein
VSSVASVVRIQKLEPQGIRVRRAKGLILVKIRFSGIGSVALWK